MVAIMLRPCLLPHQLCPKGYWACFEGFRGCGSSCSQAPHSVTPCWPSSSTLCGDGEPVCNDGEPMLAVHPCLVYWMHVVPPNSSTPAYFGACAPQGRAARGLGGVYAAAARDRPRRVDSPALPGGHARAARLGCPRVARRVRQEQGAFPPPPPVRQMDLTGVARVTLGCLDMLGLQVCCQCPEVRSTKP